MSDAEEQIAAERAARAAAREKVMQRFSAMKGALGEKGFGKRLGEHAVGKVSAAADDVVEIARESKGIIAGTAGLLGLWFLRRPIAGQIRRWWPLLKARMGKENDR